MTYENAQGDPVTDWRTLRPGCSVVVLADIQQCRWQDVNGTVTRVEPCEAPDSAWVYVRTKESERLGVDEPFLLIDGHSPRLGLERPDA